MKRSPSIYDSLHDQDTKQPKREFSASPYSRSISRPHEQPRKEESPGQPENPVNNPWTGVKCEDDSKTQLETTPDNEKDFKTPQATVDDLDSLVKQEDGSKAQLETKPDDKKDIEPQQASTDNLDSLLTYRDDVDDTWYVKFYIPEDNLSEFTPQEEELLALFYCILQHRARHGPLPGRCFIFTTEHDPTSWDLAVRPTIQRLRSITETAIRDGFIILQRIQSDPEVSGKRYGVHRRYFADHHLSVVPALIEDIALNHGPYSTFVSHILGAHQAHLFEEPCSQDCELPAS